ncbi:hypothetical protein [Leptospira santarosai]|uniref:hypothetical protein n=1 Tax=Leptospira santarosai TaxID=28183 RepID=UPI0002978DC9|nr:hypothetical protein [Leptospira santarosai]EKS08804.1 hypothetical protein LEP1GSC071_4166 [Leptospira santarosai str. JET]
MPVKKKPVKKRAVTKTANKTTGKVPSAKAVPTTSKGFAVDMNEPGKEVENGKENIE